MRANKTSGPENKPLAMRPSSLQVNSVPEIPLTDNRASVVVQKKTQETVSKSPQAIRLKNLQSMADNSVLQKAKQNKVLKAPLPENTGSAQKKPNSTGLPDQLKTGVEHLSGISLDDVKVHYGSGKPAQLKALAYAQGTNIHLAPGQEKHLPHEAWHVVQQKQGRVKQTMQMKGGIAINDDTKLEQEADVMGHKALQMKKSGQQSNYPQLQSAGGTCGIVQRTVSLGGELIPNSTALLKTISASPEIEAQYQDLIGDLSEKAQLTILQDMIASSQAITLENFFEALKTRVAEVNELRERIRTSRSVKGRFNELLYTHNTDLYGAMGVMGQGTFLSTVESNVNFRHDIDSRYAGGLTFVMKKDFEKDRKDTIYHDLYKKSDIFLGKPIGKMEPKGRLTGKQLALWEQLIQLTTAQSDFRTAPEMVPLLNAEINRKHVQMLSWQKRLGVEELKKNKNKAMLRELLAAHNILSEQIAEEASAPKEENKEKKGSDIKLPVLGAASTQPRSKTVVRPLMVRKAPQAIRHRVSLPELLAKQKELEKRIKICEGLNEEYSENVKQLQAGVGQIRSKINEMLIFNESAKKRNSSMSLVNPQLRIPRGRLTRDDIAYLIIDKPSFDKLIVGHEKKSAELRSESSAPAVMTIKKRTPKVNQAFFSGELLTGFKKRAGKTDIIGQAIKEKGATRAAREAMDLFVKLLANHVKVVDRGEAGLYSHQAGRMADKSRGRAQEADASEAAKGGMEISPEFFEERMNNSPAALSRDAFIEFQKAYYNILVEEGLFKLYGGAHAHEDDEASGAKEGKKKEEKREGKDEALSEMEGGAPSKKASPSLLLAAWAARLHGTPDYGSNNRNDCLIYAIAYGLGVKSITERQVMAIRNALVKAGHMGVDQRGFLPGYGRVVSHITQIVMGMGEMDQGVTIHIESAVPGVHPVTDGDGPINVHLFHDGLHFWWLKR